MAIFIYGRPDCQPCYNAAFNDGDCGYAGEVGGNVYDCEYWMAILIKE